MKDWIWFVVEPAVAVPKQSTVQPRATLASINAASPLVKVLCAIINSRFPPVAAGIVEGGGLSVICSRSICSRPVSSGGLASVPFPKLTVTERFE